MAKKKSSKNGNYTVSKKSMREKVKVQTPERDDRASRIVGTIFIGLGVLLVAFGIYSFIQFRSAPAYDESFEVPSLEYVTELTNGSEIVVKGSAPEYDSVAIFVNDEKIDEVKVKDGIFEYAYQVENEGEFAVSIAGLRGFPIRKISVRSIGLIATVDQTAPSKDEFELVYGVETNKESFKVTGTIEPNATIEIKRGVDTYIALADKEGYFEVLAIALDEGKNVFNVSVSDMAGNSTVLDEKVRVEYAIDGSINGDAVADQYTEDSGRLVAGAGDTLPQAAGELDNRLARNLMLFFGLAAIFLFSGSSIYAFSKRK
ncbi:TPA: hypothetical protein DEP90_00830 [Patescibacteria group bacterium]|nr:hypothetical protein [Patescibacteria group bacterium]